MSIAPLQRITVCGHERDEGTVLEALQDLGCIHLIPLTEAGEKAAELGPSAEAKEALQYLQSCPQQHRQVSDGSRFDAAAVQNKALNIRGRMDELEDERDFLAHRIDDLKPWGEFQFYPRDEVRGHRRWSYQVPPNEMKAVEETGLIWEIVGTDNQYAFVVVVCEKVPQGMPVARTRTGAKPLSELVQRLEDVELEIDDLQAERVSLTRWRNPFSKNLAQRGFGGFGLGALLVVLFTGAGEKPLKRLLTGFMGLTGISKAFGDILSYLRLFALGLASASLALAFNDLAVQVAKGMPGIGVLPALIILAIGHALNLLLAIVSGFVHGLRLNLIEFFNWSIKEEGKPYRAFQKHAPSA